LRPLAFELVRFASEVICPPRLAKMAATISGFEIARPVEIGNQPGLFRLPAQESRATRGQRLRFRRPLPEGKAYDLFLSIR
jgi:hypothetical protein